MGYVDETRKKEKMISEQDLLNIGLSKNYVASIVARIKEYNGKNCISSRKREK